MRVRRGFLIMLATALLALMCACGEADPGTPFPALRREPILDAPPQATRIGYGEFPATNAGPVAISSPNIIEVVYASRQSVDHLRRYYRSELHAYDRLLVQGVPTKKSAGFSAARTDPPVRVSVSMDAQRPVLIRLQPESLDVPARGTKSYVTVRVLGGP